MTREQLVQTIKKINSFVKSQNLSEAYRAYRDLFASSEFINFSPEDQRQALRLMIYAKGMPSSPTSEIIDAHRAAVEPLSKLIAVYHEPIEHEMLGMCHVMLGNLDSANTIFRAGLAIERERSPLSDLCGSFMKRIALL